MCVWIDQDLCTGDGLCTDHCPAFRAVVGGGQDGRTFLEALHVAPATVPAADPPLEGRWGEDPRDRPRLTSGLIAWPSSVRVVWHERPA
jgi:hypothetical protein